MVTEPTRIELDSTFIVSRFGHLTSENGKQLEDLISPSFQGGEILCIHIIVESTGLNRGLCKFIDPTSTYKSECGNILNKDGTCPQGDKHAAALQPALIEAD